MRSQLVVHITGGNSGCLLMIIPITIKMLHVIGSRGRLKCSSGTSFTITIRVINEPQEIKSTFILPEIFIYITGHHHRSLTTCITITAVSRIFGSQCAERRLQVYRRTTVSTPTITEFIKTYHS